MNKFLRYLIFALLVAGIGYAVYSLLNKPAVVVTEVVEGEKVAEDTTQGGSAEQVAQEEAAEVSEEAAEVKQEEVAKPEEVKVEEVKKEEPAKR